MKKVFLSYARPDHDFAELVEVRLSAAAISPWRDQGQLRAGEEWLQEIEKAITDSAAVVLVLSPHSVQSVYVTFEWAYALGRDKTIIPIMRSECQISQKLASLHYLDFSNSGNRPWQALVNRIENIEVQRERAAPTSATGSNVSPTDDLLINAILAYLARIQREMVSFEKLREKVHESLTEERGNDLILKHPTIFRRVRLTGGRPGIAKVSQKV